jgi:hypothetical protein
MNKYLFFVLVIFLSGCRKKDDPEIGSIYLLPQEVKDYSLFLPGTYWIYQDSTTGNEDSVYVINSSNGKDTFDLKPDDPGDEVVEFFQFDTKSSFNNGEIFRYDCNTSFYQCVDSKQPKPCFYVDRANSTGSGFCFLYDFYVGAWVYSSYAGFYSKITIVNKWSILNLNSINYNNVVELNDDKNITENSNRTNFFFAKNIGIVRKELLDSNRTWSLIRYKIVQ